MALKIGKWYRIKSITTMVFFVYKIEYNVARVLLRGADGGFKLNNLPIGFDKVEDSYRASVWDKHYAIIFALKGK